MKILYYDCFSGISGDMNLGALLDLGVDRGYLTAQLSRLGLDDLFEMAVRTDKRKGISGTRVEITLNDVHSKHRRLPDIQEIITHSTLSEGVKERSLKIFEKLAEAEAGVHGISKEQVHFHEVGAVDAIVDVVGAAVCLEFLRVDKVMASSIELGGGFVHCAHGLLPVPAPAVTELLKGIPVTKGRVQAETTTPTGAAILAATVNEFTDSPKFTIDEIGYGIGGRDTEIPNVLRVFLFSEDGDKKQAFVNENHLDKQYMIETNIDDMNPEFYELAEERLYQAGALDVFKTPIIMKKGRLATKLSVLSPAESIDVLEEIIFRETTAIGLRKYAVQKVMMKRETGMHETRYGTVRVKYVSLNGKRLKAKPEYEDCKKISKDNNLSLQEVYQEVSYKI